MGKARNALAVTIVVGGIGAGGVFHALRKDEANMPIDILAWAIVLGSCVAGGSIIALPPVISWRRMRRHALAKSEASRAATEVHTKKTLCEHCTRNDRPAWCVKPHQVQVVESSWRTESWCLTCRDPGALDPLPGEGESAYRLRVQEELQKKRRKPVTTEMKR